MTQRLKQTLFLILILVTNSACATYSFGKGSRTLPGGYDRVAVPMFTNKTQEVGIEPYFTENLRTEFERSHIGSVTSQVDAQLVVEGTIISVTYAPTIQITNQSTGLIQPPAHQLNNQTNPLPGGAVLNTQYSVVVVVRLVARKNSDQSVLWASDFSSQRQYLAPSLGTPVLNTAAPLYNQNSRVEVIANLAKDMMSEAHDRLTENF